MTKSTARTNVPRSSNVAKNTPARPAEGAAAPAASTPRTVGRPAAPAAAKTILGKPRTEAPGAPGVRWLRGAPRPEAGSALYFGLDVGDQTFAYCAKDAAGRVLAAGELETTEAGFVALTSGAPGAHALLEAGARSGWIQRLLLARGWDAVVTTADTLSSVRRKKDDRVDAEDLAELARTHSTFLRPVRHKPAALLPLAFHVKVHTALTAACTKLGNTAQGLFKELGLRVPKHDADNLAGLLREQLPAEYKEVFRYLLAAIEDVRKRLHAADRAMARKARKESPEAVRLAAQVPGVGLLTAVAVFVAFHEVKRFRRARDAGPYFGFDVKKRASGDRDPQLGITKAGNKTVRWLLVQSAQHLLRKNGDPSALRDFGLRLLARGGPGAHGRAAVAVARKLAVLLLALLQSGEDYRPYPTAPAA